MSDKYIVWTGENLEEVFQKVGVANPYLYGTFDDALSNVRRYGLLIPDAKRGWRNVEIGERIPIK